MCELCFSMDDTGLHIESIIGISRESKGIRWSVRGTWDVDGNKCDKNSLCIMLLYILHMYITLHIC